MMAEEKTKLAKAAGDRVRVERGQFLIYRTKEGEHRGSRGREVEPGAWFKCSIDEEVTYDSPTITRLEQDVLHYDPRAGVRDGTFRHFVVRRFFQDERMDTEVTPQSEEAMHAEHLKLTPIEAGREFAST
jgi:hypothetical protein